MFNENLNASRLVCCRLDLVLYTKINHRDSRFLSSTYNVIQLLPSTLDVPGVQDLGEISIFAYLTDHSCINPPKTLHKEAVKRVYISPP